MNLLLVLVLVVFNYSSSANNNYQEYSTFVTDEDLENQFFSDELEDADFKSESEDSNRLTQESKEEGVSTRDPAKMSFPFPSGEEHSRNEEHRPAEPRNSETEPHRGALILNSNEEEGDPPEGHLLDRLSNIYNRVYGNYEDSFHKKDREANQPPTRREINAWRDELSEPENAPWSLDTFYPRHGSPSGQSDYFEEPGYPVDSVEQKNSSTAGVPLSLKELLLREEQPYYQKNYYYNYYPFANGRTPGKVGKWNAREEEIPEKMSSSRENSGGKKPLKKNACKQYLQFLKYAFEKLDENDYNYDYNEDYNDEWRRLQNQKNQKVFAVHLLGPTLYVDNSGKVSQMNSKDNNNLHHGVAPTLKAMDLVREDSEPKATTSSPLGQTHRRNLDKTTTPPSENVFDQPKTTTDLPWLKFSLKTNLTSPNATKERRLNPEVQHRSTFGSRIEEEWRQHVSDHAYETTIRTTTEHTVFDEYDYGDGKPLPSVNTYSPKWYPSPEYHQKPAKTLPAKENDTQSNVISSETSAAVGSPSLRYNLSPSPFPRENTFSPTYAYEASTEFPGKKDDECNDKVLPCPDTVNVTYPLNGYCNRYVSCESGRAIRKTCPEGLHFNLITKSCDLPHNSFCSYNCSEANGYYGVPGDCGGYFICKNYNPEYRMCPPRMHWDIHRTTCTFAELSSCPLKCGEANEIKHYEGDCKAYVICMNGIPYYHKCPPNMNFDGMTQTCVPARLSQCEDDPRLLTKMTNPNHLCRDVEVKLGSNVRCNYVFPDANQTARK